MSASRSRRGAPARPRVSRREAARTRLENDERRAQLLLLALGAFSQRPYDEVSVHDIAGAAGVSKGLLYHYFPTKRDLYLAALREAARQMLEQVLAAPESATPLARVRHGVDAYLGYVSRHAAAYAALMRGGVGSDPAVARVVDETRAAILARLLEGADGASLVLSAERSPLLRLALRGWIGCVEAASLEWLESAAVPQWELRDLLVDALIGALQRAGAPLTRDW